MKEILSWRVLVFGFLSWLLPFVAAFGFYDSSGALTIPQPLFKSIMVLIGGGLGCWLLVLAFRRLPATPAVGLAIGSVWLVINLVLDLVVLLPMSGASVPDYLADIGLRYLILPIIAAAMGAVARQQALR